MEESTVIFVHWEVTIRPAIPFDDVAMGLWWHITFPLERFECHIVARRNRIPLIREGHVVKS
jgi:hypothetical protein